MTLEIIVLPAPGKRYSIDGITLADCAEQVVGRLRKGESAGEFTHNFDFIEQDSGRKKRKVCRVFWRPKVIG